ncbi:DUF4260 domain-containing protein [Maribacter halichondriae]|uniref:DUF4260 domain-containing protein n=1 Tax=Maribacter halichondriae TaxID=2980554 RepID=UPI002358671D|nr:DUF4260 domain-containing protein [Maribacter sp. Hal144]
MKTILKIEEFFMLLLGFFLFMRLDISIWWFFGLLLVPDIGMLGYLINSKVGAITYNLFHHKGLAILLYFVGSSFLDLPLLRLIGIILFAHASMDRIFGYGLKYNKGFKFTHLGEIGNKNG